MEKSLLEQALEYAEHGFYVFPCREKYYGKRFNKKTGNWDDLLAKRPFSELAPHGIKDATLNKKQIEIWWKRKPNAMIGCDLARSGLFVIDLDFHNDGVNGINYWHSLGISDDGCGQVMTPTGKGLHIYFLDPKNLGVTRSNEKVGLDFRGGLNPVDGKGKGYSILPNSFWEMEDGQIKYYRALNDLFSIKKELTIEIAEKLGIIRKEKKNRGSYVSNLSSNEELKKAVKIIWELPFDIINDYDSWLRVGMYLRKFGDEGKYLWFKWTDEKYLSVKPNSKRRDLEYKWISILNKRDEITIGTLYYYLKGENNWEK